MALEVDRAFPIQTRCWVDPMKLNSRWILILVLLTAGMTVANAAEPESAPGTGSSWKKAWKWSLVAVASMTAADAASSMGRYEANPLLRNQNGQFGGQQASLKAGVVAGSVLAEWLLSRHNHSALKTATIVNGVTSAWLGYNVASNIKTR